jgi:hypothetical protein
MSSLTPTLIRPERVEELSNELGGAMSADLGSLRSINTKTKLLSLNARIEAARAGAAGAAFSVVAGEVMELAKIMDSSFQNLEKRTGPLLRELGELGGNLARDVRGQRLSDLAATHLDLIDRNLYERSCDVRWWATEGAFVKALQTLDPSDLAVASQRMGKILDSYTVYFDLVLCDANGQVVANGRPETYRSAGSQAGSQTWFREGRSTESGAAFGFEGVHALALVGGERVLVYSTAVRDDGQELGRPLGVLGVVFRWDALAQTIVDQASLPPDEVRRTSVLILQSDGRVLARSPGGEVLSSYPVEAWLKRSPAPRFHFIEECGSTRRIVALARSQGYETYSTGWISALVQTLDSTDSPFSIRGDAGTK